MTQRPVAVTWAELGTSARLFRIGHAAWGVINLTALAWVWTAALRRRRGYTVNASVALLSTEGVALLIGRGNCPFGPYQRSLGDPVPMFEWFLPPKAAKAAVPLLTLVSLTGLAALVLRPAHK